MLKYYRKGNPKRLETQKEDSRQGYVKDVPKLHLNSSPSATLEATDPTRCKGSRV